MKKLYPYAFLKKDLPTDLSIVGEGSYFSINSFSIFSLVNFSLPVELSSYFVSLFKSNNLNNSVCCFFLINLIFYVYIFIFIIQFFYYLIFCYMLYFSITLFSIFSFINFSHPVELSSYFFSIMKSNNCNNSVRCSFLINLILNVYSEKLKTRFINNLVLL